MELAGAMCIPGRLPTWSTRPAELYTRVLEKKCILYVLAVVVGIANHALKYGVAGQDMRGRRKKHSETRQWWDMDTVAWRVIAIEMMVL